MVNEVQKHHDFLKDKYSAVLFTALYGSQNYNLATENSDVDTRSAIMPDKESLIFNKDLVTKIYEIPEHAEVKDIRLLVKCWLKQNINFIEILYTKEVIIDSKFKKFWDELQKERDNISHYSPITTLNSTCGMLREKYYNFEKMLPCQVNLIQTYGYSPKQLYHELRLKDFITRYFNGEPYEQILVPNNRDFLMEVKNGKFSYDEAKKLADETIVWSENFLVEQRNKINHDINTKVEKFFKEWVYDIFETYIF